MGLIMLNKRQQGRIHGNPVTDGWAVAVMRKPLANQKSDVPTNLPTDTASSRVACPRLKKMDGDYDKFDNYDQDKNIDVEDENDGDVTMARMMRLIILKH